MKIKIKTHTQVKKKKRIKKNIDTQLRCSVVSDSVQPHGL